MCAGVEPHGGGGGGGDSVDRSPRAGMLGSAGRSITLGSCPTPGLSASSRTSLALQQPLTVSAVVTLLSLHLLAVISELLTVAVICI